MFGFICLHAALCVHVCHLGRMSCDDDESDSLIPPSVDEQPSTSPEPLPVPAALGLRTFYGTRKSKSTELKPVAVRAHAARLSRKPSRYND